MFFNPQSISRRAFHQSCSAMLALFACLLVSASTNAQTSEVTGAIEGKVFNKQTEVPIPNIKVEIIDTSGIPYSTRTTQDGTFRKGGLRPGSYTIKVSVEGFEEYTKSQGVFVQTVRPVIPQPIPLIPKVVATAPTPTSSPEPGVSLSPATTPTNVNPNLTGNAGAAAGTSVVTGTEDTDIREEIETTDGRRGGGYSEKEVSTLPLGATTLIRTFDELALLLPGVSTPPQTQGDVAGPGVGAGVGSAGQFSVNGLRSRANNFTVDGSDNNDEDIGVRRQGFLSLVPQSIESIQEYRVITLLAPAQYGRNLGAQVNAISKSGTSSTHGTFFGFLNTSQLNARNFFDSRGSDRVFALRENNQNVLIDTVNAGCTNLRTANCVILAQRPLTVNYASGGKESSTLAQAGFVLGGPLVPPDPNKDKARSLFYFISAEGQLLNANKEANFVVPTVAQRGIFNSGVTGVFADPFFPVGDPQRAVFGETTGPNGAAVLSLFPFPNNPNGIYGANTFTRTLPASGFGKIVSGKTNGNFYINGMRQDVTARYNFTDDARTIPVTGGGIFSSIRPRVRTQNFSTFLNSEITGTISNEVRASYGRTRLVFDEVPDREFLVPSQTQFNDARDARFLLNAPYLANFTVPNRPGVANTGPVIFGERPFDPITAAVLGGFNRRTTEGVIGPLGQVRVAGFSSLGVDVFNFPQSRVNNTYQLADTLSLSTGRHRFAFGADIRRVELNSDLPRNSRSLLTYAGVFGSDQRFAGAAAGVAISPLDLVAAGAPSGALQTFAVGDSAINLRYYEYNFFGQEEWRIRPNLSLSYGLRYEYNTPPGETNRRIENTFNSPALNLLAGLRPYLNGRTRIYDPERKNFAPRVGFAYAPELFGSERQTVIRAGYGIYYDQILGAVVSQSRNVFPNFLTLNFGGGLAQTDAIDTLQLFNPANIGFERRDASGNLIRFDRFRAPGTLNRINPALGSFQNFIASVNTFLPAAGFGVTLPARRLKTPVAQHYSLTVEQQLSRNMVISIAYVGTQGRHLLRLNTPNVGESVLLFATDFDISGDAPVIFGNILSPSLPSSPNPVRPTANVGAVNLIETTANSSYNALQAQLRGRFSGQHTGGLLFQSSYTFGKVLDDVSDAFDLAGAPALPQDSEFLNRERGPANFDVRHRFSYNVVYTMPTFNDSRRAFRAIFGGLEIASTGQFQTAQPFTVNSIFDVNGDGNFTDRLNSTNGLVRTGNRRQPLQLTGAAAARPTSLLAGDFLDGSVGRNTFRASNLLLLSIAFIKNFAITERQKLIFRAEIFNLTNRANFGIPIRFLEAPGFGQATDTVTPGRRVQFALKYSF